MFRIKRFLASFIGAVVTAQVLYLVTPIPCGEDGWRWGLTFGITQLSIVSLGILIGIGSLFIRQGDFVKLKVLFGFQILGTLTIYVILILPHLEIFQAECL